MSLKNSQNIENLKHEYIYGSVHKDGRRSFKSLDNLIKEFELSPSTIYRRSSKESWKDQRIAFRAELSEEIKKAKKYDIVNDIQFIQNKATSGLSLILDKAIECLHRNLPAIAESDEDDNEGFRRTMEMLDQIADFKRDNPGFDFK